MKKIFYCTLSVAFLTVALASCGKSSKGKMTNEWKVTEYNETVTDTQSNGDKTVTTTAISGTTATMTTADTPNGGTTTTTTQTATINSYGMKIEKDGTWSMDRDLTSVNQVAPGINATTNIKMAQSGTWSFVGTTKGDEFKKNERVIFNILSESNTTATTVTGSSSTSTSTSSDTYLAGENTMIYTVVESKSKELQLEAETSNATTSGSSTSSSVGKTTITLEEK